MVLLRQSRLVQAEQPDHALHARLFRGEQANHLAAVEHRQPAPLHFARQRRDINMEVFGPAEWRVPRVVIRLIAHIPPVTVVREGHAQAHQMVKRLRGEQRLDQRDIPMHAPAVEQTLRHLATAIRLAAGEGELIIRLLVAAGIIGRAPAHLFRDDQQILAPQAVQIHRAIQPRRPGTDNDGVDGNDWITATGDS